MQQLQVALDKNSYPIYIGAGLLDDAELLQRHVRGQQVFIVSSETVAGLYLQQVKSAFSDRQCDALLLPDGEAVKNLATIEQTVSGLLANGHNRDTTLLALGGGVVGDAAGFAAAVYQRGIDFIQIPTTLLAQVDSSVGGKTAVNHPRGKNMIGAFHQPKCVLIDTRVLLTLPDAELSAGLAEVVKHAMLEGEAAFAFLEQEAEALLARKTAQLTRVIASNCRLKAGIVAKDEKEHGLRALLNLGHTFGHAIETGAGHGSWLHGEAVAAGLLMAADLSLRMNILPADRVQRLQKLLPRLGLRAVPPKMPPERWLELMQLDKKVRDGKLRLILLRDFGDVFIDAAVDPQLLRATLTANERLGKPAA